MSGVPEGKKNAKPRFKKKNKTQPSDTVFLSVRGCNVASLVISPLVPGLPMVFVYQLKYLNYRKYISKWRVCHRVLHSIIKPMVKMFWICSLWGYSIWGHWTSGRWERRDKVEMSKLSRKKVLPEMHANVILPVVTSTAHWIAWFGHTSKQMRWCFIDCIIVVSYCPTNFTVSNLNCFLVKGMRKHRNESN